MDPATARFETDHAAGPKAAYGAIRDNVDSLITWGLIKPRMGRADDWQGEGNDLGIKSKWSPHEYPAMDPAKKA